MRFGLVGIVGSLAILIFGAEWVALDGLGRLFKGVILVLGGLALLLPPARREIGSPSEFHALMLFAIAGLMMAVGTNHLMFLFVALELASLSLYLLVGFPRTRLTAEASMKYFLFGGVSVAFMLFGLSLIYGFSGSVILAEISVKVAGNPNSPLVMTGLLMVLVGLAFKLAAAPFHYWAPDVYQGASATSVGLVAAASKVAGMVVMVRILGIGFTAAGGSAAWGGIEAGWSLWLAVLAAASILMGNLLALAQSSVRRLLAYSAVANSGYLLVGLCANSANAFGVALYYVIVYGLATFGALAVTAAVERERGSDDSAAFAGLIHRSPFQALCLLVSLASLAGIPPLAGFVGKFAVFAAALKNSGQGLVWLVALAAVMSAVSLYYYLMVIRQAFVNQASDDSVAIMELSLENRLAILVPAVGLVILGCYPGLLMESIVSVVTSGLDAK
jgi:NADH-quinone oxidoreductase subunit N